MFGFVDIADAFVAGTFLFVGVNNFDLFLRRRNSRSHLWLAATCAGALLVNLTGIAVRNLSSGPRTLELANYFGVGAATVFLYEFVVSLHPGRPGRWGRLMEAVIAILFAALCLTGSDRWVPPLLVACAVLLLVAMGRALVGGWVGDRAARWVGGGFLALSVCLLADISMEMGLIPSISGLPGLGFTVLFLASSYSLNERFVRAHRELDSLRRDLEIRVERRTQELRLANQKLAEASRTDSLTGLPNRRGFLDRAGDALRRARRAKEACTVVMGDVDHFKAVNDTRGHAAGDQVLQTIARAIRNAVRDQDLVARWGGEEIILLLPDTDAEGGRTVAETAREAVREATAAAEGGGIPVTISFGVALHSPEDSIEVTIAAADAALYRAKAEGRDRVVVAETAA